MISQSFKKFEEKIDNFFDKISSKKELYDWNRKIKRICKKYYVDKFHEEMYLGIQKDILEKINDKPPIAPKEQLPQVLYQMVILGRVYELNKEFPVLIELEFFHSANAITRQMVEIYTRVLYCRHDSSYKKVLIEKLDKNFRFPNTKDMVKILKESNIEVPYIKGATKKEFLDKVYSDFQYFSDIFHPSPRSFASNIWVVKDDKNKEVKSARLYIENPSINENEMIVSFPKQSPVHPKSIKSMCHEFFIYSSLILTELSSMGKENENKRLDPK